MLKFLVTPLMSSYKTSKGSCPSYMTLNANEKPIDTNLWEHVTIHPYLLILLSLNLIFFPPLIPY